MKQLTQQAIKRNGTTVEDERIINFLDSLVEDIKNRKIEVTEYIRVMFSLLLTQLIIYYKLYDNVMSSTVPIANNVSTMNRAHDKIVDILERISLSPMSRAKVKNMTKNGMTAEENSKAALDALLG